MILDFTSVDYLDSSAIFSLERLHLGLQRLGIALYLSAVKGSVYDVMNHSGFIETVGALHVKFNNWAAYEEASAIPSRAPWYAQSFVSNEFPATELTSLVRLLVAD